MFTHPDHLMSYSRERMARFHREVEDRRLAEQALAVEADVLNTAMDSATTSEAFGWTTRLLAPLRLLL